MWPARLFLCSLLLIACKGRGGGDQPKQGTITRSNGAGAVPATLGTFETGIASPVGTRWHAVTDKAAGGVSSMSAAVVAGGAAGTGHALHLQGNAKLGDFPFPFAGARLAFSPVKGDEPTPMDISTYQGIELWLKGDGKQYLVRFLSSDVRDFNYPHVVLRADKQWTKHRTLFRDLVQFDWGEKLAWTGKNIKGLMVTNYNAPGEDPGALEFYLDEVKLF
jgi:hypothetical protein